MTFQCEHCGAACGSGRWAKTRAHSEGWYFQRDGRVFCPEHRPPWAPARPNPATPSGSTSARYAAPEEATDA